MTTGRSDVSAFLRGRLHMAGVAGDAPLPLLLDVLTVLVVDVPKQALEDWRGRFDRALQRAVPLTPGNSPGADAPGGPDRATWGLLPEHQEQLRKLAGAGAPE